MPYPISKTNGPRYASFGGVNQKISRYLGTNIQNEAIDISNFDLQTTGALTKRFGSTLMYPGFVLGRIGGFYEFTRLNGASYLMVGANSNLYAGDGSALTPVKSGLTPNGIFDFVTFVNLLFVTNGSEIFKFDGSQSYNFGLPPGPTITAAPFPGPGDTGSFVYAAGFLNNQGYYGPATNIGATVTLANEKASLSGFTNLSGYGVSAIVIYRNDGDGFFERAQIPPTDTSYVDDMGELGEREANDNVFLSEAPQSMELFNNAIFYLGFSSAPSTLYFSEPGEPETIVPIDSVNPIEVRTNDGDKLTCARVLGSQLVIGKQYSLHAITGTDSDTYSLREVTTQYGCLSKRSMAVWGQKLWALDEDGIVEFDGANTGIISQKVENVFDGMNVTVAKELSWMCHVKQRNEVWTAIPAAGASYLNKIVVYDYVNQGWYFIDGINACSLNTFFGNFSRNKVGFGDFSGTIHHFDTSLYSDNGRSMTCMVRFPFTNDGQTTEQIWRRLWLDLGPQNGATKTIYARLYKDQSDTPALERTIQQSSFQYREEFGVPAKDLSPEFIHNEDSALVLNGFTLAHRYLRDV